MPGWHEIADPAESRRAFAEAWRADGAAADREMRLRDARDFLDTAALVARWMLSLLPGRELDEVAAVVKFVAVRGLERDARAANVAYAEYHRFLRELPPIPADQVVEMMICFYVRLGAAFQDQGVNVERS